MRWDANGGAGYPIGGMQPKGEIPPSNVFGLTLSIRATVRMGRLMVFSAGGHGKARCGG